jgi:hypothetical protein
MNGNTNDDIVDVVLASTTWCPYCTKFKEIFNKAQEQLNLENIQNCIVNYLCWDLDISRKKEEFIKKYPGIINYIEGYPTVIILKKNGNNRPKMAIIPHSVAKTQGAQGIAEAIEVFNQNVINKLRDFDSDNKVEHVGAQHVRAQHVRAQSGGMYKYMTSMEEVGYRNKYLKYKSKYIKLKNN